jgi:hypothetical protein
MYLRSVPNLAGFAALQQGLCHNLPCHSATSTSRCTMSTFTQVHSRRPLSFMTSPSPRQAHNTNHDKLRCKVVHRSHHSYTSGRSVSTAALGQASVPSLSAGSESATAAAGGEKRNPRAAFLVIGNEILTGKIQDTNTATLGASRPLWLENLLRVILSEGFGILPSCMLIIFLLVVFALDRRHVVEHGWFCSSFSGFQPS